MADSYISPPLVLDTNVLVAGACRHQGSRAYELLLGILEERFPLVLTAPIALEYLDVLQRPAVRALTGLSHRQSEELVTDLIALSRKLQLRFSWRPNLRVPHLRSGRPCRNPLPPRRGGRP